MKQVYNSRLDEAVALNSRGKKMKQNMSDRRHESEGMEKSMGKRKYSGDKSMGYMGKKK